MDSDLEQQALILDDDDRIRRLLTLLVQDLGLPARGVDNFEGFKEALNPSTGLVVLDLSMPDVDGVEVIRHLALIGFKGRLVVVSGAEQRVLDSVELLAQRSGLSIAGTLRKPFSPLLFQRLLQPFIEPRISPTSRPRSLPQEEVDYLLESRRLLAYYQPKLDLESGRICGAEALVRCDHPALGLIGPALILKQVAETQLSDRINLQIIDRVFDDMARWKAAGRVLPVAINLNARLLSDLSIPDRVVASAQKHGVKLDNISFEITETTFSEEMLHALDVLTRLRLKGIRLSIDDFGTGYSTEERLNELPFTELKIDRSLIIALDQESGARDKVGRCVDLARRLGLKTVAEGVETREQLNAVRMLGVDVVQGYMIARPMSAAELPAWTAAFEQSGSIGAA